MNDLKAAIMFYQAGAYRQLKDQPREKIIAVAKEIDELAERFPLVGQKNLTLNSWPDKIFTGVQLIAWLTVCADILSGGQLRDREMCRLGDLVSAYYLAKDPEKDRGK